jgi:hypothetical protein
VHVVVALSSSWLQNRLDGGAALKDTQRKHSLFGLHQLHD